MITWYTFNLQMPGCVFHMHSGAIKGNNGVVHYINNTQSLQWLIKTGPHEPYIPLITADMFTAENLKALMNSGKISGVMVIHTEDSDPPSSGFSPEHTCPNDNFGLYTENKHPDYSHCKKTEWNPLGSGLSFEDYDFPIFVMTNQSEVNNLIECYKDRNEPVQEMARRYPLCAVQMTDRMDGAKDTVTCMRRSSITNNLEAFVYCDPLGDYNVFGCLQPTNKSKPLESDSVIVAAAKLDSNSMFYSVQPVPGAENDATGYVTLLSAIEALGRLPEDTKQAMKNIMFTFLNGESWDYIGSSRMVYDMERGEFPSKLDSGKEQPAMMNLSHISHFVELRQLGLMNASQLWVHGDPVSQKIPSVKSKVGHMMDVLSTAGGHFGLDVQRASDDQPLPPASFQRFLRKANISGVVVTDHGKEFANRFYQSRFDLPKMIQADYSNATEDYISPLAEQLNNVSSALAQTLYKLAHPNGSDVLNANINITNQMLYCFLYKPDCTLFRTVTAKDYKLSKTPIPKYVGVFKESTRSQHTTIVEHLMAYFLGKELEDVAEDDCKNQDNDKIYKYEVIGGVNGNGTCLRSFSYYTPAESRLS
ncbi:nicastrin-like isoform X2 [Ptychodera flava]|uniref:nicastrin-like isoform X2 n=1 Tax=Ptychodera flava TaxID=63121 RepID=UPI00396A9CF5